MTACLSTAYLPPVQWFAKLLKYETVYVEQYENYQKQTYRNRCVIAGPNGPISLTVPSVKLRPVKRQQVICIFQKADGLPADSTIELAALLRIHRIVPDGVERHLVLFVKQAELHPGCKESGHGAVNRLLLHKPVTDGLQEVYIEIAAV